MTKQNWVSDQQLQSYIEARLGKQGVADFLLLQEDVIIPREGVNALLEAVQSWAAHHSIQLHNIRLDADNMIHWLVEL